MDYRKFESHIVLRVDRGEEVMAAITALCEKENILLASISGLGAADRLVMGLYDIETQRFSETVLDQPLDFADELSPLQRRSDPKFQMYFDLLWRQLHETDA